MLKFLISPAVIFSLLAGVIPLLFAFRNSLLNIDLRHPMREIGVVGLKNFSTVLGTERFLVSLKNSFLFSFEGTVGAVLLGFGIALFLYYHVKGRPLLLTASASVLILPALTSKVSVGYMWRLLYHPTLGFINYILRGIGVGTVNFLASYHLAMQSIIFADIWQWSGFIALFLLAGMEALPKEWFEDARVIGASFTQEVRYIIVPNLKLLFLAVFLLKFMISLRSFGLIRVMTRGGPGTATESADMYLYWLGILGQGKVSIATAGALIVLVTTIVTFLIIINLYRRYGRR